MDDVTVFGMTLDVLATKTIFFLIVVAAAGIVQFLIVRFVRKLVVVNEHLPRASILENLVRCVVWFLALLLVLEPVFGIEPSGFVAALGVTSIVISFGLQDTIKNIIGGFILMFGKVIEPGDYVTISGVSGTVIDITMRHTVVENRSDERILIPNSVLNSSSVIRLPASSESKATIDFTMKPGFDPDLVSADILACVRDCSLEQLRDDIEPRVLFNSFTEYGVCGTINFYLKDGIAVSGVRDAIVRCLANKDYFSHIVEHSGRGAAEQSQ